MFAKILVAIDIRETEQNTFKPALSLAKATGAKLISSDRLIKHKINDVRSNGLSHY